MKRLSAAVLAALWIAPVVVVVAAAYNKPIILSRRSLLTSAILSSAGAAVWSGSPVLAADAAKNEDVYFGNGCFWHGQYGFIKSERDLLGRDDHQLTAKTGYAGGKSLGSQGRVCYHNLQGIADYGKLGHGEVVGLSLPTDKIVDFTEVYFSLFNPKTKERVDPQDRGAEYRSLLGLPGGIDHPLYPAVEAVANKAGFKLQPGQGNDPDTLGKQIVYVYDTAVFPFHQAEVYHQYHDDFQSPAYGRAYNKLADLAFEEGRIQTTGCPDRV